MAAKKKTKTSKKNTITMTSGTALRRKKNTIFDRLEALHCFEEVYDQLVYGMPIMEVARFIKKERGECMSIALGTLLGDLGEYRSARLVGEIMSLHSPKIIAEARLSFGNKVEELRRLENIFLSLEYDVECHVARSRAEGIGLSDEAIKKIEVLIKTVDKMHDMKMDLGLTGGRDLGKLTIDAEKIDEVKSAFGESAVVVLKDPVSRARVLNAYKKLQAAGGAMSDEESAVVIETEKNKETGSYESIEGLDAEER